MSKMVRSVASHVIKGIEVDLVDIMVLNLYVRECEEGDQPYFGVPPPFTGVRVRPLEYIPIS